MNAFKVAVLALAAGLAIGWLTALSRSGLLMTVVPALLTAALGAVPLVASRAKAVATDGTQPPKQFVPLALVAIGIALGATGGTLAVARGMFAVNPRVFMTYADELKNEPELRAQYLAAMISSVDAKALFAPPLESAQAPRRVRSPECMRALKELTTAGAENSLKARLVAAVEGDVELTGQITRSDESQLAIVVRDYCR